MVSDDSEKYPQKGRITKQKCIPPTGAIQKDDCILHDLQDSPVKSAVTNAIFNEKYSLYSG